MNLFPDLAKVKPVSAIVSFECGYRSTPYVIIKILIYESGAVPVNHRGMPRHDDRETRKNAEPKLFCLKRFTYLTIDYQRESNRRRCKQARKTLHHETQRTRHRNHVPPATITISHTQVTINCEVHEQHDQNVGVYKARHLYKLKRCQEYERCNQAADWTALPFANSINDCYQAHTGNGRNRPRRKLIDTKEPEETTHEPES